MEIDGKIEEEIHFLAKPTNFETISQEALDKNKRSLEELTSFPSASAGYLYLKSRLGFYVNKYSREDKFIPCGYNVNFDIDFLNQFFLKQTPKDKYLFSWIFSAPIDVRTFVGELVKVGYRFKNHTLETMCKFLQIPIDAHDALSDIRATRELYLSLRGILGGVK